MKLFFQELKKNPDVSDFTLKEQNEKKEVYSFSYKEMTFSASQTINRDTVLSRISIGLNIEDLLENFDSIRLFNEVNNFNKSVSTIKVVVTKIDGLRALMRFSVEYSLDDNLFNQINLEKTLILILASSKVFFSDYLTKVDSDNEEN